jgi:capsular polysaccharide transport system permease protein
MTTANTMAVGGAVREMGRVIGALILRETQTRFGRQHLGYIWALLGPIILISLLSVLFSIRGRYHPPGMTLVLFLVTGIVPFYLFRQTLSRGSRALRSNMALLAYPQVQIMDIALARFLLEFVTYFAVFSIIVFGVFLMEIEPVRIQSPLVVLAGIVLIGSFGFALSLIFGSLSPLIPDIEPIVSTFLGRPLFFISGVFYTIDRIPEEFRFILIYNPLFHALEWTRSGFFPSFQSAYLDLKYALICFLVLLFLGLVMQRAMRRYAFIER